MDIPPSLRQTLETAVNEHSCALACIVSLSRDLGRPITQQEAINTLTPKMPSWKERPGGLTLVESINLMMGTLLTKAHIITADPPTIIRYWHKPERIGGLIIIGRQLDTAGKEFRINHAWRILDCNQNGLLLMNPLPAGATIGWVKWDLLPQWKGYALLLE
jgi:hypothetical protein